MKKILWTGLAVAVWVLAGCASAPVSEDAGEATRYSVNNTETFQLLDPYVQSVVACTGLIESLGGDGRLEVAVNIKNRGDQPLVIQVGCLFKRTPEALNGQETPWQTVKLEANATETVCFKSPGEEARRYAIRVRSSTK